MAAYNTPAYYYVSNVQLESPSSPPPRPSPPSPRPSPSPPSPPPRPPSPPSPPPRPPSPPQPPAPPPGYVCTCSNWTCSYGNFPPPPPGQQNSSSTPRPPSPRPSPPIARATQDMDSFVPPPDMPPPPGTPPPLDVFKLVLRFEGADYMSITGNPDLYMKFVSDLKARTALAMKIPTSSVKLVSLASGSVIATLHVSVIDPTKPATVMFAVFKANIPSAFDSAFKSPLGITGVSSQAISLDASVPPFPPAPPSAPPQSSSKSESNTPSSVTPADDGPGSAPYSVVPGGASSTPGSPSPSSPGSSVTSTTVIALAVVLSVVGAALLAVVAVMLVKRGRDQSTKVTASPSDREASMRSMQARMKQLSVDLPSNVPSPVPSPSAVHTSAVPRVCA